MPQRQIGVPLHLAVFSDSTLASTGSNLNLCFSLSLIWHDEAIAWERVAREGILHDAGMQKKGWQWSAEHVGIWQTVILH